MDEKVKSREELITELKTVQERFRNIVENIGEGIGIVDTNENFIFTNLAAGEIFGMAAGDLTGHNLKEFVEPVEFEKLRRQTEIRRQGEQSRYDIEIIRPDGQRRHVRLTATPMFDQASEFTGTLGIFFDTTENKKNEMALEENEAIFRTVINNSADLTTITNNQGVTTFVSPQCENVIGYPADHVLGKSMPDFIHPDDIAQTMEMYAKVFADDHELKEFEYRIFDLHGNERWICHSAKMIRVNGKPFGIQSTIRNITDRKHAEKKLTDALNKAEAASRLKSAFIYNISHEVRTPLNGILGFSRLIAQEDIPEKERLQFRPLLELSSNRLLKTITNYMDISRIASGNLEVNKKQCQLNNIFNELYKQYQPLCAEKKIKLNIQLPQQSEEPTIFTDTELLHKAVGHLLDNSLKFTLQGEITFGYSVKSKSLEFFISDTGIGISQEAQDRIFENFVQEEVALSRGFEGSGLGLSIARGLVKLLGGTISLISKKGEGSIFSFNIPVEHKTVLKKEKEEKKQQIPSHRDPVVLIVEDDDANRAYIKTILQMANIKTIQASNGKEAVEKCQGHPEINLVLMDLKMPVMDGFEATKILKSSRNELPVIAITAFAMSGDKKQALDSGCDDYISKPVNKDELLNTLKKFGIGA